MMPSFPWESLKAETMRNVCKDLGASATTRRNRDGMIAFLQDVEKRGCRPSTTARANDSSRVWISFIVPAADPLPVLKAGSAARAEPVEAMAIDAEPDAMAISHSLDSDKPAGGPDSTCKCQDGISPRTKVVLKTIAGLAQDLIPATGELAAEYGRIGAVYLTDGFHKESLPTGKNAAPQWVEGFTLMFKIVSEIFDTGRIPTAAELDKTLELDRQKKSEALCSIFEEKCRLYGCG
ncbi:hypothetical protein C8J57DRAFT_1298869 [Mycena rebaudengoi]|nr:hypothetical protein C8J57DRAFT_1298869 [Mycena rebaudengoi]